MTLIEQLRLLRVKHGRTQADMANPLEITRQQYGHLESGIRQMRLDQAVVAFNELGFTLQAIESGIDDQVVEFSVTGLAKSLYRRVLSGDSIYLENLRGCLSLDEKQFDELAAFVQLFLKNPKLRTTMLSICRAVAEGNSE